MNSIKNLTRLKLLHQLIRSECTGSPFELAKRLRVSERLVYLLVEQLKDFEAVILRSLGWNVSGLTDRLM